MEVRIKTAKEWLQRMQTAARDDIEIVIDDSPLRRMFGFRVSSPEEYVVIGLADLKNTMGDLDGLGVEPVVLRSCFTTPEGRARLPGLLRG